MLKKPKETFETPRLPSPRIPVPMATSPPPNPSSGDPTEATTLATAALAAPARLWKSLVARLPPLPDTGLLAAVSDLHRRHFSVRRGRRRRRQRPALPLPLRPAAAHSARIAGEMPKAFVILDDVVQRTLSNLHNIHKSLLFWQSKAEGTTSQKLYFMIFERGPRAFVDVTCQTLTRFGSNGRPVQYILHSASNMVSTNLAALTSMQHCLAAFLAEVHSEVDKCREGLTESSDKSLHTLFIVLNTTFSKLEISLRNVGENELFTHDGNSDETLFGKLPEVDVESSQWTEDLTTDGISLIYQNLQKLDDFLLSRLGSHKKPNNLTIYWLPYTCGALGLSVCSLWLLHHSSLMGSSDIDNWIRDAKESMAGFWDEHVEKPIISIRDELFETFKQRDKGIMERRELQLTEDSLNRMLLAFCEQISDGKLPEGISSDQMMEMLARKYEKELMHPIKNLFSGELARAMLIQIQKLKLDLESGLLEMDQILRANAINFAVLAALPAFGLSLLLLIFVQTWVRRDHGAEGRGNIARCQRRLLLVDVERRLMEFQHYRDNGMEEEALCKFGLVLYTLDRLCKAVESHARETGEWLSLREDIFDLAKLDMGMPDKLIVVSRLKWMYNCLLPYSSRRLPRL